MSSKMSSGPHPHHPYNNNNNSGTLKTNNGYGLTNSATLRSFILILLTKEYWHWEGVLSIGNTLSWDLFAIMMSWCYSDEEKYSQNLSDKESIYKTFTYFIQVWIKQLFDTTNCDVSSSLLKSFALNLVCLSLQIDILSE